MEKMFCLKGGGEGGGAGRSVGLALFVGAGAGATKETKKKELQKMTCYIMSKNQRLTKVGME